MADAVEIASAPMQRPVPVTGEVSQLFRDGLAARHNRAPSAPRHRHRSSTRTAQVANGETLPYDLFVGIPKHRAPDPLPASGLAVHGWVAVDQTNLRTQFPGVYAIGDVCTGPRTVPKAGIFAESAAMSSPTTSRPRSREVTRRRRSADRGICYAEFGGGFAARSR